MAEAFRWYNKIMKWRPVQRQESGALIPYKLELGNLIEFRRVYDTSLDDEYLFEVVLAIDNAYLEERMKQARPATPAKPSQ